MSGDIVNWELTRPDKPEPPVTKRPNRFATVTTVNELMLRVVGASAVLIDSTGFDKIEGVRIADDAIERLIELGWA
jgi:hypothetical protein